MIKAAGAVSAYEFIESLLRLLQLPQKGGPELDETGAFLSGIRALCPVGALTLQTHDVGGALAKRCGVSVYDALFAEDMHDGLLVAEQLCLANPFA